MNDKQNARIVYADIINLPLFQSSNRPHMSLYDRAAQFAPFAALTGFDDMVTEEARLTDKPIELSEIELETLNRKMDLVELLLHDGGHPTLSFTYFEPDVIKEGGRYLTRIGIVKKIDTFQKIVRDGGIVWRIKKRTCYSPSEKRNVGRVYICRI